VIFVGNRPAKGQRKLQPLPLSAWGVDVTAVPMDLDGPNTRFGMVVP